MTPDFAGRVLAELHTLNERNLSPADAQAHLEHRVVCPPGVRLELLWERHPSSGRRTYGALLEEGELTHSLQTHAPHSLPWVLQDAIRWSDGDVLRVNSRTTRVEDVMARLELLWTELGLSSKLVHTSLIQDACAELRLSVPPAELQEAVDRFRSDRGLDTPEATSAWLRANGMTHERLEAVLEFKCLTDKLKAHLVAQLPISPVPVESAYVALQASFATASAANEFHRELGPTIISTDTFISKALLAVATPSFVEADLPQASEGLVVPPMPSGRSWVVMLPLRPATAAPTAGVDAAFARWLEARALQSDITWLWGPDSIAAGSISITPRQP